MWARLQSLHNVGNENNRGKALLKKMYACAGICPLWKRRYGAPPGFQWIPAVEAKRTAERGPFITFYELIVMFHVTLDSARAIVFLNCWARRLGKKKSEHSKDWRSEWDHCVETSIQIRIVPPSRLADHRLATVHTHKNNQPDQCTGMRKEAKETLFWRR